MSLAVFQNLYVRFCSLDPLTWTPGSSAITAGAGLSGSLREAIVGPLVRSGFRSGVLIRVKGRRARPAGPQATTVTYHADQKRGSGRALLGTHRPVCYCLLCSPPPPPPWESVPPFQPTFWQSPWAARSCSERLTEPSRGGLHTAAAGCLRTLQRREQPPGEVPVATERRSC